MNQSDIVKKVEDFILKEFGTQAEIEVSPLDFIYNSTGGVSPVGQRVRIDFKVVK